MKHFISLLTILLLTTGSLAAQHRIVGIVLDAETGEALQFANVWIKNSHTGTTTDRAGRFVLNLARGEHTLVASYIGYGSGRRTLQVPASGEIEFRLKQTSIEMPTVTVTPGDNPALRIIRKAIEAKEKRKERLQNYSLTSHSKLAVRIEGALQGMNASSDGNGMTISASVGGGDDSTATESDSTGKPLPILLESQTEAWWAKPDRYKEVIKARKQSALIPAEGNIMISAFFIVDFSADELNFSEETPTVLPISERGLDSYYYRLVGTTTLDSTTLHMIEISPLDESEPLLEGMIYISDSSWSLSMVDVHVNDAAMPPFFNSIGFRQHFRRFTDDFWMPVDVMVDADIDIPIVDIQIDINGFSVLQDYHINEQINEDFFDRTRIKVLKEADERDSTYWLEHQKIPNTPEEVLAYRKADTVKLQMDSVRYNVGFMDYITGGTTGSENAEFSFPGILSLYRFNRVEGHALNGDFSLHLPELPLQYLRAGAGYGFSDERFKYHFGGFFSLLNSPELYISAERHYERDFIDARMDPAGETFVTLFNLLSKYDYRDYFYRDGWSVDVDYDLFLLFPMGAGFSEDRYYNAMTNTDWSIFKRDENFRSNPPINEGRIRSVTGYLSFDNRDFIDNAGDIRRFGSRNHVPSIRAGWHEADIEGEQWNITTLGGSLSGRFNLGLYGQTSYSLTANYADDALPTQMLYNLQGSMNWLTWPNRYRTLQFREFGGDQRVTAYFTHNLRDRLFRLSHIPFLKSSGWGLKFFASGGWTSMSDETRRLQTVDVRETGSVFWEAGFTIDNIFSFLSLDLAWRLNHFREGENFYIGLGLGI
jgi:hypothetical protein